MSSLAVVICAYTLERWEDLQRAVESVRGQSTAVAQIVVVVDHNDDLLRRAQERFSYATVLPNSGLPGLSAARNTGVQVCTADIVAFLDDDAHADENWARQLLSGYSDKSVVGVGGLVLPDWRARRPSWFPDEFLWVVGCSYRGQPTVRAQVRNAIGANMSFRRSVLHRTGGFDTTIGRVGKDAAGCEETELSLRAASAVPGGHIVLEPTAVVHHAVTPDRVTRTYFRRRCQAEGRSKAIVSTLTGPQRALSSERTYAMRTLPTGLLRGLLEATQGDAAGAARSWTLCEGLMLTAGSYLRHRRQVRGRLKAKG